MSEFNNKNLLVVAPRYNTFTKGQIDRLSDHFDEVIVLVKYNRLTSLSKIIDLPILSRHNVSTRIASSSPENVTVIKNPLSYLPFNYWYSVLGDQHYYSTLYKILTEKIEFDIIHSHFTWTSGYVGMRLSEYYDIPCVLTIHENQSWLQEEMESDNKKIKQTWENTDAIIRVNEKDIKMLRKFNSNTHNIPNGYSTDRFSLIDKNVARDSLGVEIDSKIIFSLGDLTPRKNFELLIKSASDIDYNGKLICAIGGQGRQYDDLQALASKQSGNVDFRILGYISDEDLNYWMNACDIFSLSSKAEGNPTVMFEALGCGKPYVGTNVGGVDEIILSNNYGIMCEKNNREELSNILEKGIKTNWNREKIWEYSKKFTWESIARDIISVYKDLQT